MPGRRLRAVLHKLQYWRFNWAPFRFVQLVVYVAGIGALYWSSGLSLPAFLLSMLLWTVGSVAILGAAFVVLSRFGLIPDRPKRSIPGLCDRKLVPDGEVFAAYWADCELPENVLLPLLKEVGSRLDVEPSLLRPGDRFYRELLPVMSDGLFDDGFCELYWLVEQREKKYGVHIDWSENQNLGEFIKAIGSADAAYTASLSPPLPKSSLA